MHDIERYLLWGAILVLFALYFWPKMSGYTYEPNSITKLAEFSLLNDDIKRLYNDQILRGLRAWAPTFNKWWTDLPMDARAQLTGMMKQAADQQVTNATQAKTMNGVEILKKGMAPQTVTPSSGNAMSQSTTSKYMVQPFLPMMSGFSLQDVIAKANSATKI
jgi:hypothetical protein